MNNKELQNALAKKMGVTVTDAATLINALSEEVVEQLQENGKVNFLNMGVLEVRKKSQRILTNPATQKKMLIPPKLSLAFRPSVSLKNNLKNMEE